MKGYKSRFAETDKSLLGRKINFSNVEPYRRLELVLNMKLTIAVTKNGVVINEISRSISPQNETPQGVFIILNKKYYPLYKEKNGIRRFIDIDEYYDKNMIKKGTTSGRSVGQKTGYKRGH